jgi:hypothetical protein
MVEAASHLTGFVFEWRKDHDRRIGRFTAIVSCWAVRWARLRAALIAAWRRAPRVDVAEEQNAKVMRVWQRSDDVIR